MSNYVLAMTSTLASILVGVVYAGHFGWALVTTVLGMETDYPRWLEGALPLKGRWLSLLLTMPLILLVTSIAFALVAGALFLMSGVALWLFDLNLFAGLLAFGAIGWLVFRNARSLRQAPPATATLPRS